MFLISSKIFGKIVRSSKWSISCFNWLPPPPLQFISEYFEVNFLNGRTKKFGRLFPIFGRIYKVFLLVLNWGIFSMVKHNKSKMYQTDCSINETQNDLDLINNVYISIWIYESIVWAFVLRCLSSIICLIWLFPELNTFNEIIFMAQSIINWRAWTKWKSWSKYCCLNSSSLLIKSRLFGVLTLILLVIW